MLWAGDEEQIRARQSAVSYRENSKPERDGIRLLPAQSPKSGPVHIVWFKRDLRAIDHRPLAEAADAGPVVPLFVVESALWRQPDISGRQWEFVRESLAELRERLAALGQPLIVRTGNVIPVLEEFQTAFGIAGLWSHEETGNGWTFGRDRSVAAWCRERGIPWHQKRQTGVIRKLKSRDGWARRWDRFMAEDMIPAPAVLCPLNQIEAGAIPDSADLRMAADICPERQTGGRRAALETLNSFLNGRGQHYRTAMSSPVTAFTACSRLSPHLAWGTVAMREVAQATRALQRQLKSGPTRRSAGWRGSLTSFSGRLHWHCHFMQKLEDAPELEFRNLHPAYDSLRPAASGCERYRAWAAGQTGLPYVDACMRALTATGWMNFRMRAMLMAVASYHLWLDWRKPGEHLARLFTDYEPGIHWPQIQMQSGTTGINTIRIYNPVKQGYDHDPGGTFVRRWVPELDCVPLRFLHEPWIWDGASGLLGRRYPFPVIDHLEAARAARRKVWAIRQGPAFRDEANVIRHRHGSRRSGLPVTGRKRAQRSTGNQLSLSLDQHNLP